MLDVPTFSYEAGDWVSNGVFNPAVVGTILADTGVLDAGLYDFMLLLFTHSTSDGWLDIEHRNAANDANVHAHRIDMHYYHPTPAIYLPILKISMGERLRGKVIAQSPSAVQLSIVWARRYG